METIDLNNLSASQLADLEAQLKEKQKADLEKKQRDLETLEVCEHDVLGELFPEAQELSNAIVNFKRKCLAKLEPLIDMKITHGKAAADQETYSFKTKDNKINARVRYNRTVRYDDGVQAAISFAKEWLHEQAQTEQAKKLVGMIDELLSKDSKQNYSPANLLKFVKKAEEMDEPLLLQAAEAIKKSIYDDMTSISVLFSYKDEKGIERKLPLSATKA